MSDKLNPSKESIEITIDETMKHKHEVVKNIDCLVDNMLDRAACHDDSKLSDKELLFFATYTPTLKGLEYGSDEYKDMLKRMKPAIDNHYKMNNHHPEHYENGIEDMSLLDLLEMIADWKAAVLRHEDGDLNKSLEINRKRFNISDQLYKILCNTVKRDFN